MFILLLIVALAVSFLVCFVLARLFRSPIHRILQRLVGEDIYTAWTRYLMFALYVVGISGGVRIWQMERYVTARTKDEIILELTGDRWTLELYGTVIGTLQSVAWMLLVFFLVALLAFVVVKGREIKRHPKDE
ncbi:hypothetical protein EHM69_09460 [candidate division KSB1 bacterium]|nr:MAG: hypothetical protein EHM69_09460 [candidate division KSB1 bacterium]